MKKRSDYRKESGKKGTKKNDPTKGIKQPENTEVVQEDDGSVHLVEFSTPDAGSLVGKRGDVRMDEAGLIAKVLDSDVLKAEIKQAADDLIEFGKARVRISAPIKRKLTDKEEALRDRDMNEKHGIKGENGQKEKHSRVLTGARWAEIDAERKENWIPPVEVEKMPQWKPVIQPVIDQVISEQVKDVKVYMETVARSERAAVVSKLAHVVHKKLPVKDYDVIESLVETTLFMLLKDQGVGNLDKVKKILK